MSYIEWGDEFAVDNDTINDQHRTLVGIVNELHDAVTRGTDPAVLESNLSRLVDYTGYHFQEEENLLSQAQSKYLPAQKHDHDRMTRQVLTLQEKHEQGSATLIFEILDLLHDWLMQHVKGLDKKSFAS